MRLYYYGLPLTPGARIGSYEIIAFLGEGGMGEVYKARDMRLNRFVAVKFLSDEIADVDARRRFQREAEMASSLNHPHIVTVHDVGELGGRQYLVTELVDGGTLRDWARSGKRSWRQVVELLIGVADGLAAAHTAGILHRDIKPENVLVTSSGYAKVVDFGLAKLEDQTKARALTTVGFDRTRSGMVVGTIPYMSPEQIGGRPLDPRSDVFAFGILLYELLAGRHPFAGGSTLEILPAIVHRTPDPLPSDIPMGLRAAVEKALEKDPKDRYQSMQELVIDLRRVSRVSGESPTLPAPPATPRSLTPGTLAGLVAAAAIVVAIVAIQRDSAPPVQPVMRDSIAVLPFRNIGPSAEAEYFAEGISDDISAQLSKLVGVRVVSGNSVRRLRDSNKAPAEIGRELGVSTLVAGSVRLSDQDVRVVVELIDCATSLQIAAESFDRPLKDIFAAQTEIAQRIGGVLKGQLSAQDARSLERKTIGQEAFQLYLQGRYHWNKRTPEGLRRSLEFFKQAAATEPDSALLHAGLADAYLLSGIYDLMSTADAQRFAEESALRALALDANLPEAQATIGSVRQEQFRWAEAEAAFQRAIQLNPSHANAHHWYALLLTSMARFEEAKTHMQHALSADPYFLTYRVALGYVLYAEGNLDAALREYARGLELEADHAWVHRQIAMAHQARGAYAEALNSLDKAEVGSSRQADLNAIRAAVYALAGKRSEASRLLADLERTALQASVAGAEMALAYFALGQDSRGYEWLERAVAARENDVQWLGVDPRYRPFRQRTRFQQLLGRLGLPQEARR